MGNMTDNRDQCLYDMTHANGEACGGYAQYDPDQTNARGVKGAWLHLDKQGVTMYETDFCSACGIDLRGYVPPDLQ